MSPTWRDFWFAARYGAVYFCRRSPWLWGSQVGYYDGWHFCLHCGPFSIEVS